MKKVLLLVAVVLAVLVSFLTGSSWGRRKAAPDQATAGRRILYYVDPMNPAHTSAKPGLAPCGMKMEPVYAEEQPAGWTAGPGTTALPPGTVRILPAKQQLIGLELGTAEKKTLHHTVRLLGKVATDETRVYRLYATVDGWITKAFPVAAGNFVKKNETLAAFYSPEFLSAGQALLFALNSVDRVQTTGHENPAQSNQLTQFKINLRQYSDSLRNLGMGELQIEEMIHTREFMENVNITSPTDGFILFRNISEKQRFDKGTELFRIADLGRVWILADVFEKNAPHVRPGLQARVTRPHQDKPFTATLGEVLPLFDNLTRTLKVRFEADNPNYELKPDMFVDLEFPISLPEAVVVPADAVLDAGLRQTVFVDRGNGYYEPRSVETGWRLGDQVQILQGLVPGERIVISGNFLLDSESRMKLAAAGVHGTAARDPVCGMAVDEQNAKAAGRLHSYQGRTHYFCNPRCQENFASSPEKYVQKAASSPPDTAPSSVAAPTSDHPTPTPPRDQPHH